MSRDDRDRPGLPERDEDAPVTPAEQARAEAFGRWLDGLAAGEPLPPAMDSDDRALLETATMVLASSHAMELAPDRTRRLVDQALGNAMLGPRLFPGTDTRAGSRQIAALPRPVGAGTATGARASQPPPQGRHDDPETASASATDLVLTRRRKADRVLRHLPWAVASLAAAAAIILFAKFSAEEMRKGRVDSAPIVRPLRLSVANTSRPADPLFGVIARRDAGRASERLDILFADRLDGFRDLNLRRALGKEQP